MVYSCSADLMLLNCVHLLTVAGSLATYIQVVNSFVSITLSEFFLELSASLSYDCSSALAPVQPHASPARLQVVYCLCGPFGPICGAVPLSTPPLQHAVPRLETSSVPWLLWFGTLPHRAVLFPTGLRPRTGQAALREIYRYSSMTI